MGANPLYMMINVLDFETYEDDKKVCPYCISYSIGNNIFSIYKENENDIIIEFLDDVISKINTTKITFFIHNINFDGMILMDSIFKNNLSFNWVIKDTNIYMIELKYLEIFFEFKCSYKFLPISLKKIEINEHKKTIFPYSFVNKNNLNYIGITPNKEYYNHDVSDSEYNEIKNNVFNLKNETIKYCENDVKITLYLINSLINVMDKRYLRIFNKTYSSPSLSYKIFNKYWNNFKINEKILKEEDIYVRKSYFGGRCEVFGNPKDDEIIHYFDFSGMYGQCMMEEFPIENGFFVNENLNYRNIGFHCIKFSSNMEYPILPHHSEDGKLIFANGVFIGCYWYEEIIFFVENGGLVLEIYSSYIFKKKNYVFKNFINEFTSIKMKGGMYKIFGKLMINSLYGGMAMNEKKYESIICFSDKEAEKIHNKTDVLEYFKKNRCYIFKVLKNKKSNDIINKEEKKWSNSLSIRNVIYASIIASKARIKLYKGFNDVIKSGGRIFYSDTDSIAAGYKEERLKKKYGDIEWSEIWKDAVFIAPKFYSYIDKNDKQFLRLKGISSKDSNIKNLKKIFYSNTSIIKYEKQLNFNKKKFELEQNYIDKIIFINKYNKRIFSKDKKETKPLYYPPYNE